MTSLPDFPRRIALARLPTPLRPLERLSRSLNGPRLWLKCDDLTGSVLSGNKVRKLEFLLADALDKGADTVITSGGLQSNHCRATALACARLGLRCVLLLREGDYGRPGGLETSMREGNLFLDGLAGAELRVLPRADYVGSLERIFQETEEELRAQGARPYAIPTGGSNGIGLWGYLNAGLEIQRDCEAAGFAPDAIVCATGSGGTQSGLSLAAHYWPAPARAPEVIGMAVCDSAEWFERKAREDVGAWARHAGLDEEARELLLRGLRVRTIDAYIGPGYAKPYPEVLDLIRRLAREEGVVLEPVYTGKAFHAMLEEIRGGRLRDCRDVVFVHTGGIFGLFPYAGELA